MAATVMVSGGGFKFKANSTGGTWSWTVDANNVQNAGQYYSVTDVSTPWGPLSHLAVPIPADVVTAMADSIRCVQQQLDAHMSLVSSITNFSVAITEGDAAFEVGSVVVENDGAFGSFMSVTATPDVQWLSSTPSVASGLGRNDQADFAITMVPDALLASGSPYTGTVNLQDDTSSQTTIPVTVTVQVVPRPAISVSSQSFTFTYSLTTGAVSVNYLTITNSGPATSSLTYTLCKVIDDSTWLAYSPSSGGPLPSGVSEQVILSLVSGNIPQQVGVYSEKLRVYSSNASNSPVDIDVTLEVTV